MLVLALATLIPLARLRLRLRPRLRFAAGDRAVIITIAAAGLAGLVLQQISVLLINWATQQTGDQGALTRFTWANALYLLPYAVLAAPLLQMAFPRLAAAAEAGDGRRYAPCSPRPARRSWRLAWLGAALLVATAVPVARVFVLGPGSGRTAALAAPIIAFAPGGGRVRACWGWPPAPCWPSTDGRAGRADHGERVGRGDHRRAGRPSARRRGLAGAGRRGQRVAGHGRRRASSAGCWSGAPIAAGRRSGLTRPMLAGCRRSRCGGRAVRLWSARYFADAGLVAATLGAIGLAAGVRPDLRRGAAPRPRRGCSPRSGASVARRPGRRPAMKIAQVLTASIGRDRPARGQHRPADAGPGP